ncbi:MAG: GlsB/YeaQ/YmgE family stress response membrane protein [Thiomicrospira sp.]|uniref:GlsB/YeaQ/YmgE family stress response membrane protein n=1 Tax=Thiomicrospira sp. TaxID=935 RepID=UPI0019F91BBA|nr:GlsB/YeaQ/YmgE family stress response membrane protein [Thiomicrospira sp.]MBE0494071.1 GlsB/YeaQ/YmgE family stress response membrane protein [Thiomicrospira sp.]
MDITNLIIFLAVGALVGWLAGTIMKGSGFGIIGNIIVGIVGAILGGIVFDFLGIIVTSGLLGSIIMALIGAVILLSLIRIVKRA